MATPSGTVTFLFTDLEGSTSRWQRSPERMRAALARHDELLRESIEDFDGKVFKTIGDAFCAAFADPHDALCAAVSAQRDLHREDWGEIDALRVRMALHTGVAEQRDGDYFGQPLNRVARLLSAGHGGQVLVSHVTQELVCDNLPKGVTLRDLGQHRLKDLYRPEHVFQVLSPGLQRDFPPLKTLDLHPNNLPAQPTPLVGREREVRQIVDLLKRDEVRLVTLMGPGGTGKTRLGLQVAAELLDDFPDGVYFVNLAPINDPGLVVSTIASVLDVHEASGRPLLTTLVESVRGKHLLLVVDNLEHLTPAAVDLSSLLRAVTTMKLLATSRVPLHLSGEHTYPVPPLGLPDPVRLPPVDRFTQYEAVALFIQRAQAVTADFQVTAANAPALAEICYRLEGLPLAIELAAARIRTLPPHALLQRLEHRLPFLTGGARDLPARQQTLRNAIAWSYDLLTRDEQRLFRSLSVFRGGWTLEAANAVAGEGLNVDVLDGLEQLVEHSIVRVREQPDGTARYAMLETIREFGLEQLAISGETAEACRRHAAHFLRYFEQAVPEWDSPRVTVWVARGEAERDNVRAALGWATEHDAETALRLNVAFADYWWIRGHYREGRRWFELALGSDQPVPAATRAPALFWAGFLATTQSDYAVGQTLTERALTLFRELGDAQGVARCLSGLGRIAMYTGHLERAAPLFEESAALFRGSNSTWLSTALMNLGAVLISQREYGRAAVYLDEAAAIARELGLIWHTAMILFETSLLAVKQDDPTRARKLLVESLTLQRQLQDPRYTAQALEVGAWLAAVEGHPERVARLLGAASSLRNTIGVPVPHMIQIEYDQYVPIARAAIAPDIWDQAWSEGQVMTLDEAIDYALTDAI